MRYNCKRCGYETDVKQALLKHFDRKTSCTAILSNVTIDDLKSEFQVQRTYNNVRFSCKHCDRPFNDRSNMYKHQKVCKKKINDDIQVNSKLTELTNEIKSLKNKLKEFEGTNFTVNNTQNANAIQNNIINVNLKDFGMESQGHLTKEFLNKCFADKCLVDLIENLHFDKECPENYNVRLRSKKQELMEVFSNGKWLVKDQDQTLTELIQSGYRILRMHGKRNKDTIIEEEGIDEDAYNEIVRWLETIYEDRKEQKPIKRDLIILFINNQTMLLGRDRE